MEYTPQIKSDKKKETTRPRRIRELYAALATAPDETINPVIARHFPNQTRQQIEKLIAKAENVNRHAKVTHLGG